MRGSKGLVMISAVLLAVSIWFGIVVFANVARGVAVSALHLALFGGMVAGFIYSMGWIH